MKRFDIDRLISHAYSLLLALVFLYAYQNLSGMSENGDLYVRAGFTGILYSLAGCVVCVFPILCALGASEDNGYMLVSHMMSFQIGRFAMLFVYAVGSDVFFAAMRNLYPVQVAAGGAIMIIFGAGILAHKKIFSNVPARNSLFVIWGIAMGLGCSLEATPFLFPLWLSSGPILHKFLSYALFSLIAVFFPLLILIPLVRAGRNSKGYWRTIRTVLGESSGLFLILLGLLMFGGAGR